MNSFSLWVYRLLTAWMPESRGFGWKNFLLRLAGARIGRNVRIYSSARILGTGPLEIGDDVHIGPGVLLYTNQAAKISIGSRVDIAPRVTILTGSHEIDPAGGHIAGMGTAKDVTVGDGCWIGACATILGGAELLGKTVVAAGSVVTGCAGKGQCLLAGSPAVMKKTYG